MSYSHLVKPGTSVSLKSIDPDETKGADKEEATKKIEKLGRRIEELQELLYAAGTHSMLVVLQGRDTSGKDGAIRRISNYVNAQSCRVASFKVPSSLEARHDFLWRVHAQAPARGELVIFNRSHYEDVLVVRVHQLVEKSVWKARFEQINQFESLLASSNTIIVKLYLHISGDEQKERLLAREADVSKAWKLSVGDWTERELRDEYREAYEDALAACSTDEAPWRIVPANHKWFRDLAIAEAIHDALKPFESEWMEKLSEIGKKAKAELSEYRKTHPL